VTPGENKCQGLGECAVPLEDANWAKARKNLEAAMTRAGKKFGAAPRKVEGRRHSLTDEASRIRPARCPRAAGVCVGTWGVAAYRIGVGGMRRED
jgi:hypothetical protein